MEVSWDESYFSCTGGSCPLIDDYCAGQAAATGVSVEHPYQVMNEGPLIPRPMFRVVTSDETLKESVLFQRLAFREILKEAKSPSSCDRVSLTPVTLLGPVKPGTQGSATGDCAEFIEVVEQMKDDFISANQTRCVSMFPSVGVLPSRPRFSEIKEFYRDHCNSGWAPEYGDVEAIVSLACAQPEGALLLNLPIKDLLCRTSALFKYCAQYPATSSPHKDWGRAGCPRTRILGRGFSKPVGNRSDIHKAYLNIALISCPLSVLSAQSPGTPLISSYYIISLDQSKCAHGRFMTDCWCSALEDSPTTLYLFTYIAFSGSQVLAGLAEAVRRSKSSWLNGLQGFMQVTSGVLSIRGGRRRVKQRNVVIYKDRLKVVKVEPGPDDLLSDIGGSVLS